MRSQTPTSTYSDFPGCTLGGSSIRPNRRMRTHLSGGVAGEERWRPSPLPINMYSPGDEGPPEIADVGPYTPGTPRTGDLHGVPNLFGSGARPALPAAPPVTVAHPLRLSHMKEGDLVHKVQPTYPALARSARIQGVVMLQAVISKQGTIENLRILTGHPMLAPAAIDAVRQWRYRPYILNKSS